MPTRNRFEKYFVVPPGLFAARSWKKLRYQNRGARNRVQIVSMLSQSWQFRGTKNGLFALSSQNCRDGVPYVYARDLTVDAADQVVDEEQRTFEMVEMLLEIKKCSNAGDKRRRKGCASHFYLRGCSRSTSHSNGGDSNVGC